MNLDQLVAELIRKHEGGEKFFDNLDKAVQRSDYLQALYSFFSNHRDRLWDPVIIVSGEFGRHFANWHGNMVYAPHIRVIHVEGGLRHTGNTNSLEPYKETLRGKKAVFFDDSYYSGNTRKAVKKALRKAGATLIATFVVYDGSKEKHPNVKSLFRYYDHY